MESDGEKKLQRVATDVIVRYGAGSHFLKRFTSARFWNSIAWFLIALGVVGWIFFLAWSP